MMAVAGRPKFGDDGSIIARVGVDHAVALMPLWLPTHDWTDISIRAQCECGWFANFDTPITLERVNEICRMPHGPK